MVPIIELDDVDKKILRELQRNGRVSFKTVAKEIGVSEATVFVRVKKLTEKGVLKGFKAIVEPKAVGKTLTAFILVRAQPKAYPAMLTALKKLDDVYEIYDITGQYYSILKVRTDGTDELSKIIDEIGAVDGVAGTETMIVFRTVKEDFNIRV
ncbi:MAG: Lrp/AsnC family transcriptional regulator [Candidatus Bathyarchaeia archaeon]|jgi:Lrp/AsnC family transcriptional regulator for asnA, asnC and gidA